jgi:hypothetical protein
MSATCSVRRSICEALVSNKLSCRTCDSGSGGPRDSFLSSIRVRPMMPVSGLRISWPSMDSIGPLVRVGVAVGGEPG